MEKQLNENMSYEERKELIDEKIETPLKTLIKIKQNQSELIQNIIRSLNDLADSYQRTADSFESMTILLGEDVKRKLEEQRKEQAERKYKLTDEN